MRPIFLLMQQAMQSRRRRMQMQQLMKNHQSEEVDAPETNVEQDKQED